MLVHQRIPLLVSDPEKSKIIISRSCELRLDQRKAMFFHPLVVVFFRALNGWEIPMGKRW